MCATGAVAATCMPLSVAASTSTWTTAAPWVVCSACRSFDLLPCFALFSYLTNAQHVSVYARLNSLQVYGYTGVSVRLVSFHFADYIQFAKTPHRINKNILQIYVVCIDAHINSKYINVNQIYIYGVYLWLYVIYVVWSNNTSHTS